MSLENLSLLQALEAYLDELRALHPAAQVDSTTGTILAKSLEEAKQQLAGALLRA